jgi:Zn-dependent peptidase ImmA (M78 family)
MPADKQRAWRTAREVIQKFAVKFAPVQVERIARVMKIRVQYAPLDGDLSGMASIRDGVSIIGVNALHHPNRQRFTLSHEIGHFCLHRDVLEGAIHVDKHILNRDALTEAGTDDREIEANAFASELLMPEPLLKAALGSRTVAFEDDDFIASLGKRFRVSDAAMRFRLFAPR